MATQTKAQLAAAKKKAEAAAKKAAGASAPASAPANTGAPFGAAPALTFDAAALAALVAATLNEAHPFMYMSPANTAPLEALGYAETRPDMTGKDEAGVDGVAARATPAGMAALEALKTAQAPAQAASPFAAAPAPAAAVPAAPPAPAAAPAAAVVASVGAFKIVSNVPIPAAKRFGKASTYPFDALEVNQGFFVPATEKRENPAKSMASTVNSAKARYAVLDGKNTDGSDKFKNTREFVLRNVADGGAAGFGDEFKGVRGAGIWRTA